MTNINHSVRSYISCTKMKVCCIFTVLIIHLTGGIGLAIQKCTKITHSQCQNAGYSNTAQFPDLNGKPYQEVKGKELNFYLKLLSSCSQATSAAVLCSLYFPKCVEHLPRPILPCRSVCNQFVHKCGDHLDRVAMQGMFAAICDLLPLYDGKPDTCFTPPGFNVSQAVGGVDKMQCHSVGIRQCQDDLHYNATFVSTNNQNKSEAHLLQLIIATKCSPNIEKFTCFTRFPPCSKGNVQIRIPCKSLCEEINKSCKAKFDYYNIVMNDCDFLYPDKQGLNGLCTLTEFPAPWPIPPSTTTVTPTKPTGCRRCDRIKIKECANIGYSYTFHFNDINGVPYQNHTAVALDKFLKLLTCSKYSQTILCSLYLPKCDMTNCSPKPVLPCRRVCYEFVRSCSDYLSLAAIHGLMIGLCDLLPWNNTAETPCFFPAGFKPTAEAYQRHICYPISNKDNNCHKDFSYNTTFITPSDQAIAKNHLLMPIIDSKCSTKAEKFFCYTRFPPCGRKDHVFVPLPCRSMCNEVMDKCKDVFDKLGLPIADCNFLLPDGEGEDGICRTDSFPIPFRHFKPHRSHQRTTPKPGGGKSSNAGLIAGVVILIVVIIVAVVIGVLYYRRRKLLKPFQPQELHNVEGKDY